jgi:hypothetical protein
MATLYTMSEQVMSMLQGGDSPAAPKFERDEVKRFVIQFINQQIKTQHLTEEMAGGEAIPDGTVLAEYDNVAVEKYKNVSRTTLPAMPVKMPLNIGVFHVSKSDDIINGFIPFEAGQLQMIGEEPFISDILGQVGYEPRGKYLIFNRDITEGDDDTRIDSLYMLLAVKDLSLYNDWEMLPITGDMEAVVIANVYEFLSGQSPANKKVDVISKPQEK